MASGNEWKKIRSEYKNASFSEPDFTLQFNRPQKIVDNERESWYTTVRQQKELKDYVVDLIQSDVDTNRVFHVSIANKTGKPGDSVANVRK